MLVKEFVEKFVERNTIIRLWYKLPKGSGGVHEEVIEGDKPMMEHELVKSEYNDREVIGVTDILYGNSHYVEAVNLVIKKRNIQQHRINSIKKLKNE